MARPGEKYAGCSWYFRFRYKWQRRIERLTDAEAGRLIKAMLYYSMTGEEVDLPGKESGTWDSVIDDLDEDRKDAAGTSETNRISAMKRWHGGAAPTGCARMRADADAYKDGKGNNGISTPCSPPRRGRRRSGSSAYSEEDLRRIEANEVDLNSGDPAKEESDERVEEIHGESNEEMV